MNEVGIGSSELACCWRRSSDELCNLISSHWSELAEWWSCKFFRKLSTVTSTIVWSRQSNGGAQLHCSQTILCPSNALSTPNDGTPLHWLLQFLSDRLTFSAKYFEKRSGRDISEPSLLGEVFYDWGRKRWSTFLKSSLEEQSLSCLRW